MILGIAAGVLLVVGLVRQASSDVRTIVHIELEAIVLILLCAAVMAKGGWVTFRRLRFVCFDT